MLGFEPKTRELKVQRSIRWATHLNYQNNKRILIIPKQTFNLKQRIFRIHGVSNSGFEPLTDGFSIQYSTAELIRQKINERNYKKKALI